MVVSSLARRSITQVQVTRDPSTGSAAVHVTAQPDTGHIRLGRSDSTIFSNSTGLRRLLYECVTENLVSL
eukprot:NODE_11414_length_306_cov_41.957198_g10501_i0.p1 GENE.NODE_11414_length_306_cov_41.957198_g10501_i0~~NODE_11414_length_306_cov_41.957198_g10501_i0.p1  ORF type:complete len:80 (-),score=24.06 NODE_11414_length_306_cov_41.957198_g10501_i0:67-276(-)